MSAPWRQRISDSVSARRWTGRVAGVAVVSLFVSVGGVSATPANASTDPCAAPDQGDDSEIPFVGRDNASTSAVVFQTSDPTWQAYNRYGGSDFYVGNANGRAYKLSYNRPFSTRGDNSGRDYLFSNEYPMLRFLERNGYDVTYISGLDADRDGALLK